MNSIVYNEDCMITMSRFQEKHFDLAIVDPPYGINAAKQSMGSNPNRTTNGYPSTSTAVKLRKGRLNHGNGKLKNRALNQSDIDWDDSVPSKEYFDELFRISKNQIIWGGNYFDLPPCRGFIIWNKKQPWENFSQAEFAWTSFDMPAKLFTKSNTGGANKEIKIHPTQKPIELYEYCLSRCAKPGHKIIDTHLGSGSNRIACHMHGFDFTAAENNTKYYLDQEARFDKYLKAGTQQSINLQF